MRNIGWFTALVAFCGLAVVEATSFARAQTECMGENCETARDDAVVECKGDDCSLPDQENPVETCTGQDCTPEPAGEN